MSTLNKGGVLVKKNSQLVLMSICLYILLTIPLDGAASEGVITIANRGLNTNWFFGMDYVVQASIVAIVPAFFGIVFLVILRNLEAEPTNETTVLQAIFVAAAVLMFTVAGCDFLSLAAENRGDFNISSTENLVISSMILGLIEGAGVALIGLTPCYAIIKKIQNDLLNPA